MIRVTGYGVIAEKPRVGKLGQFVRTPVGKTIRRIEKWMTTYSMGTTSSYQHAKFGEDRTTRSGCRCENVVSVFFWFVCWSRSESVTYLLNMRWTGA